MNLERLDESPDALIEPIYLLDRVLPRDQSLDKVLAQYFAHETIDFIKQTARHGIRPYGPRNELNAHLLRSPSSVLGSLYACLPARYRPFSASRNPAAT